MNNYPPYNSLILVTQDLEKDLGVIISRYPKDKVFLVTEQTCDEFCVPLIAQAAGFDHLKKVVIPSGEENKKLSSVERIWLFLSQNGADRKSLVVNLGGGMLTDLGGFAASTMKRGMDFINIPTTLLSQVDASVGGKTGFNFNGLKNEIGVINQPTNVFIDTRFLQTIDYQNFNSGFAEMVKHGLIFDAEHLEEVINYDLHNRDYVLLRKIIANSVAIKDSFVFRDPYEVGIRKALNFGHTVGHAFESLAMESESPLLHGYAVAYGMIVELYLSHIKCMLKAETLNHYAYWLIKTYGKYPINESHFEALYQFMTHDKKNESGAVNFTLIPSVGKVSINQICGKDIIFEALRFFNHLCE
ncbi:MAG: 3-dehydroquinate synthase [Mariniphaga sp.]